LSGKKCFPLPAAFSRHFRNFRTELKTGAHHPHGVIGARSQHFPPMAATSANCRAERCLRTTDLLGAVAMVMVEHQSHV